MSAVYTVEQCRALLNRSAARGEAPFLNRKRALSCVVEKEIHDLILRANHCAHDPVRFVVLAEDMLATAEGFAFVCSVQFSDLAEPLFSLVPETPDSASRG